MEAKVGITWQKPAEISRKSEGSYVILGKNCCPLMLAIKIVFVLAAIALIVVLILKKLEVLGSFREHFEKVEWKDGDGTANTEAKDADGVPYTAEQDFV